jgi:hypothetical protein
MERVSIIKVGNSMYVKIPPEFQDKYDTRPHDLVLWKDDGNFWASLKFINKEHFETLARTTDLNRMLPMPQDEKPMEAAE